jgi:hypothetical protein
MYALPRSNDGRLQGLERQVNAQRAQLERARSRIGQLEEALADACEYAEVCGHFPGRSVLLKRSEIHHTTR